MSTKLYWMLTKLYRALWWPTTKRPWTYAMRQTPGWKIAIGISVSIVALHALLWATSSPVWVHEGTFLAGGFLLGHLFWDTPGKYIKHKEYFKENDDVKW